MEFEKIKDYPNYSVNRQGEVFSHTSNVILKPRAQKGGYLTVSLFRDKLRKRKTIHRLVAETFIPNPNNKPEVNHINGIKMDNRVENLEWVTKSENIKHTYRLGRVAYTKGKFGSKHNTAKKVNQFTKCNKIIRTWNSLIEIERAGVAKANVVCEVCKGVKKSAGGFKWEYAK